MVSETKFNGARKGRKSDMQQDYPLSLVLQEEPLDDDTIVAKTHYYLSKVTAN